MITNPGHRKPKRAAAQRKPVEAEHVENAKSLEQREESFGVSESASEIDPQEIAALAYGYWEERGHPESSPEQDWFRAEDKLRRERKRNDA